MHDRIIRECVSAGFEPRVVYESSQWDLISGMVVANLGIALRQRRSVRKSILLALRYCRWIIHRSLALGMIWRKDRYLSFAVREWISFTRVPLGEHD